jgi:hypothetical protein
LSLSLLPPSPSTTITSSFRPVISSPTPYCVTRLLDVISSAVQHFSKVSLQEQGISSESSFGHRTATPQEKDRFLSDFSLCLFLSLIRSLEV